MMHTISVSKKYLYLLIAFICLVTIAFNIYYLFNTHEKLLSDYLSLNNCIYEVDNFSVKFFNTTTKRQGNIFSLVSIVLCACSLFVLFKKNQSIIQEPGYVFKFQWTKELSIYIALIGVFSVAAWTYGFITTPPTYDEVFSAHKASSLPLFQTLSYYMLPNNHIFFNVINNIIFFWAEDKVLTGKCISLLAYVSWNIIAFLALRKLVDSKLVAFVASLVLSIQFYNWGFSFQARGHEIYGCCEFISFLCLCTYANSKQKKWLFLNTLASVVGYACLPTFMYMHVAQILFGLWLIMKYSKIDFVYIQYQLYIFIGVFLFYLPALCYSGLIGFTGDPNLQPVTISYSEFAMQGIQGFLPFLDYSLSRLYLYALIIILLILASALCWPVQYRKIKYNELFEFFVLLVLTTFMMMVYMRLYPYYRNHIGHFYILFFVGIYGLIILFNQLNRFPVLTKINPYMISFLFVGFVFSFMNRNITQLNFHLYYCDINFNYQKSKEIFLQIPKASISCSDQCFYFEYLAKEEGYTVYKCGLNQADYYIINKREKLPPYLLQNYQLHYSTEEEMVFRRRLLALKDVR